jgi:hypothetical protein
MQYFESRLAEETTSLMQMRADLNEANEKLANEQMKS